VGLLTAQCRFYSTEFLDSFENLEFSLGNTFQQDVCTTTTCCEPVFFFPIPRLYTLCDFLFVAHFLVWCSTKSTSPNIFFVGYHRRTAAAAPVYFNLAAMTLMQGHRDQCNVTLEEEKIVYKEWESLWGRKKKMFRGVAL
jgi:hypothetical protein